MHRTTSLFGKKKNFLLLYKHWCPSQRVGGICDSEQGDPHHSLGPIEEPHVEPATPDPLPAESETPPNSGAVIGTVEGELQEDPETVEQAESTGETPPEEPIATEPEATASTEGLETTSKHILNAFFEEKCDDLLQTPTFVYEYPIEVSPLTKKCKDNPMFTERF